MVSDIYTFNIYIINILSWVIIFLLVAIFIQEKLEVLGFTIGMGGVLLILFSILQDAFGYGPTFLTMFPFNVKIFATNFQYSYLLTFLFIIVSFISMLYTERELNKPKIYIY